MRGIFPETKRSWSDGLNLFDDTRDYHEIRFGLFGGPDDSGGGGGDKPGSDRPDRSNPAEMAAREQDFRESLGFTGDQGRDDFAEAVNRGDFGAAQELERQAAERQFSSTAQDIQNIVDQQQQREQRAAEDIFTADTGMVTDMSPVEQQQIAAQQQLDAARNQAATFAPSPVGIQTLSPPGGTLGDTPVYSAVLNDPMRQDERTMNPADFEAQYGFAPRGIAGITSAPQVNAQVVLGGGTDDMSKVNDLMPNQRGITAPVAPGQLTAQELANLDKMVDDDFAEMGQRGGLTQAQIDAGIGYDARGLPTGLQTFTNNQGITATTNLAGLTQAQRDNMPGYMNPEEGGLQDTIFGNPLDTAYGYELDAQGNVTGIVGRPGGGGMVGAGMELLTNALLGPPESVEDLLNRSVYTGYGPGSQVGMDGSDDGREMSKPPTDPCPAGFVLKDGVCTPLMEDEIRTPEGGDFVFQPPTAPPTFQPMTQATPINQINPFVLQPYTPMQAQNIGASRVAQGIQGVSPTGAALGRQI